MTCYQIFSTGGWGNEGSAVLKCSGPGLQSKGFLPLVGSVGLILIGPKGCLQVERPIGVKSENCGGGVTATGHPHHPPPPALLGDPPPGCLDIA